MSVTAFERVVDALRCNGATVKDTANGVQATCPAHDDNSPSLSVTRIDGQCLLCCHAGCATEDVVAAVGLTMRDLFDNPRGATYQYPDGRTVHRTPDKRFRQSGNTKGNGLFHADRIGDAMLVHVVEGEKDVLAIESAGGVAVCSAMGAGKAHKADWSPLKGLHVTIVADRDEPGRRHAKQIASLLRDIAESMKIVEAAAGKDAADHITSGHGLTEFVPVDIGPIEPVEQLPPTVMHRGQVRMAYRLADRYANRLLHVHGIGWHAWDGTRFVPDELGEAKRAVLAELRTALAKSLDDKELRDDVRKCESAAGVSGVLDIASALEPFAAAVADLDADPYLLNCANGTLDLRTLELRPHDSADRITKVCRAAYTKHAPAAAWSSFLDGVLPDEPVRTYLQRLAGVALLGEVREHVLPIFIGTGANGKSTFCKALLHCLGDYGATAEADLFTHRENAHPTGQMDLLGRRFVVVSETDEGKRLAEATMKRLTGGDPITARWMRQNNVTFTPSHLPVLVTNHLPKVSGDDPAIWRRIRVVPWNVAIPDDEQDKTLDAALQLEADGILSWCVDGLRAYLADGLAEPAGVRTATTDYKADSDAVARFIAEECVTSSPVVKATTSQLFAAFEKWRVRDGAEVLSQKAFGQALDRHGYPAGPAVNGKRWRVGIALLAVADEQ